MLLIIGTVLGIAIGYNIALIERYNKHIEYDMDSKEVK